MTDYIAVLLAQQEEQEQGEAPELETGPLTVWLEENTRPAEAAAARRGVEQDEAGACAGPGAVIGNRYAPEAPVGHRIGERSSGQTASRPLVRWRRREKRGSGRLNRPGRSTPQNTGAGQGRPGSTVWCAGAWSGSGAAERRGGW